MPRFFPRRFLWSAAALAIALAAYKAPPAAAADGNLDGWRDLKFGTPLEQVMEAMRAMPSFVSEEERPDYGDTLIKLKDLLDSEALVITSILAYEEWTIRIEAGYYSDPPALEGVWLTTKRDLLGDGLRLIRQAQGHFQDLLTALTIAYGPPDVLITSLGETGTSPTVGRAVWRFENDATLILNGTAGNGAFQPEIGFIGPLPGPIRF